MDTISDDEKVQDQAAAEEVKDVSSGIQTSRDWTTTRLELWSYYIYYIGNNGLSGFNFGPSQFQNLLFLAGYDPTGGPGTACGSNGCVLPYLGEIRDSTIRLSSRRNLKSFSIVNSIVLLTNGISFAIQAALLLFIGAWADYGSWRLVRKISKRPFFLVNRNFLGQILRSSLLYLPLAFLLLGLALKSLHNGKQAWLCISWAVSFTIGFYDC